MAGKRDFSDSRLNVARYQVDRLAPREGDEGYKADPVSDEAPPEPTLEQRAQYVEVSIQQAIRRGDFDNLPGAGKPLANLGGVHDPDWWIRQKIEREKITGLGPPALTLRMENAGLDARLDEIVDERQVREILDDFNKRVISARRQLQGGPPVVTPPRDIEEEIVRWQERRLIHQKERQIQAQRESADHLAKSWRERRRGKGRKAG
jgi:hypothetical protein